MYFPLGLYPTTTTKKSNFLFLLWGNIMGNISNRSMDKYREERNKDG